MTVKILEKTPGCSPLIFANGDWFDLCIAKEVNLKGPHAKTLHHKTREGMNEKFRDVIFDTEIIPLGICVEVPKGYECVVVPRSSLFKDWGLLQTNHCGIIDQAYCSEKDEWRYPVVATRAITIPKGTRVAQFKVQLSQKATRWQKIKWLFSSKPKLKPVTSLSNPKRGGFGEGTNGKSPSNL